MRITVNLRHLEKRPVHLEGELAAEELELGLNDDVIQAHEPLHYDLTVERVGNRLWLSGQLRIALDCQCVRCLTAVREEVNLLDWGMDVPLEGEDRVPVQNDLVDLTPLIREDILLAFPQHPLCKIECSGLPSAPSTNAQKSSGDHSAGEASSAWAELNKLKLK